MSSDRSQLIDMGFDPDRVDWALKATSSKGLQAALDHLDANSDKPIDVSASASGASGATGDDEDEDDDDAEALAAHIKKIGGKVGDAEEVAAKSVKCSDCGKIFKNASLVSFHAEKSGHSNFEESTEEFIPLTEEQKKEKLEQLRIKLAEKRAKQSKIDAVENKANEALRRKAGQDQGEIRERLMKKEMEKEALQRKKDKIDDAKAKAAIKAQIEADKKARAEKSAREKALRDGGGSIVATPAASGSAALASIASDGGGGAAKGSDYPETRLQVRFAGGGSGPLTKTFASDAPLTAVAEWIASENLNFDVSTVKLSMTFPRKIFTAADMSKTLKENGLTPSAVLMAS